jgi:hypothetical protein
LLDEIDADACTHDVVLTVQVRLAKSVEIAGAVLQREMASLARLLPDADIEVNGCALGRRLRDPAAANL